LTDFPELGHKTTMFEPQSLIALSPLLAQHPLLAFAALVIWCVCPVLTAFCKVLTAWLNRPKPPETGV